MKTKMLLSLCLLASGLLSGCDKEPVRDETTQFKATETEDAIILQHGNDPILRYQKSPLPPPEGESPLYTRNAFIHPLYTPGGEVVTNIHPDSHRHHMGVWHAWVKSFHNDREIDFWNLDKAQGAVRYTDTSKIIEKADRAGFVVKQQHYILPFDNNPEEIVLDETLTVIAQMADGENPAWLIDYNTVQTNISDAPLELASYRYGGPIAFRGLAHWDETNSDYLTSAGKTRKDGHGTRADWVAITGPTQSGPATIIIFGHPDNYDAPQRVRIWEEGPLFFNFVPAQENAFAIQPGETSAMLYRMMIYDGEPDTDLIQKQWLNYKQK